MANNPTVYHATERASQTSFEKVRATCAVIPPTNRGAKRRADEKCCVGMIHLHFFKQGCLSWHGCLAYCLCSRYAWSGETATDLQSISDGIHFITGVTTVRSVVVVGPSYPNIGLGNVMGGVSLPIVGKIVYPLIHPLYSIRSFAHRGRRVDRVGWRCGRSRPPSLRSRCCNCDLTNDVTQKLPDTMMTKLDYREGEERKLEEGMFFLRGKTTSSRLWEWDRRDVTKEMYSGN